MFRKLKAFAERRNLLYKLIALMIAVLLWYSITGQALFN